MMRKNVFGLDVNSLYPSVVISGGISPESVTITDIPATDDKREECSVDWYSTSDGGHGTTYEVAYTSDGIKVRQEVTFGPAEVSIAAATCKSMVERRRIAKSEGKENLQWSLKIIANSILECWRSASTRRLVRCAPRA